MEPVAGGHRITLTYELTAPKKAAGGAAAAGSFAGASAAAGSSRLAAGSSRVAAGSTKLSAAAVAGSPLFMTLKAVLDDVTILPEGESLQLQELLCNCRCSP